MAGRRFTQAARSDILSILYWSHEQFGEETRKRYERLDRRSHFATLRRPLAPLDTSPAQNLGRAFSPGTSRAAGPAPSEAKFTGRGTFFICRRDGDLLVVGRVLHDPMDLRRHVIPGRTWGLDDHPS